MKTEKFSIDIFFPVYKNEKSNGNKSKKFSKECCQPYTVKSNKLWKH
jgi:hypothetical protein